jgi:RNase H-like domain found in reverse transcriptase
VQPLFNLTKKGNPWNWTTKCNTAFETLQQTMITSPVLMLLDHEKPFTLIIDTSDYTTGAILEQKDTLGQSHPITYFLKLLQPAERNYKIHDKELLAIIHALKHFQHYIQGSPHMTKILSDHANLKYFTTKQTLTC